MVWGLSTAFLILHLLVQALVFFCFLPFLFPLDLSPTMIFPARFTPSFYRRVLPLCRFRSHVCPAPVELFRICAISSPLPLRAVLSSWCMAFRSLLFLLRAAMPAPACTSDLTPHFIASFFALHSWSLQHFASGRRLAGHAICYLLHHTHFPIPWLVHSIRTWSFRRALARFPPSPVPRRFPCGCTVDLVHVSLARAGCFSPP